MSSSCPHCGCSNIEIEPARGDSICTSCGTVLSEHNIVNEVQFLENSKGGSSAIGQFVASDAIGKRSGFTRSYHGVFSRESKEITLTNAYKKIKGLCQLLRLTAQKTETSFNFFKLAFNKGLTKGRKSCLIIGACVYITCRTESSCHMLIDVSDALQIDVYELGRTYLRLSTALCISIPVMDPCVYIIRFAHKLSFEDSTQAVITTATRLVQRMKRDWMHTGRRPSGLCGAALIIAARFHNFNRTIQDVIKVVRVHESTLRKRLTEFGETPSSALTTEQFLSEDLAEEQDPPSFIAARKKEKERLQLLLQQEKNIDSELLKIQQEIEEKLVERKRKLRGKWAKYDTCDKEHDSDSQKKENLFTQNFITQATLETIDRCITEGKEIDIESKINIGGIKPSAASLGLKDTIQECMEIRPADPLPCDSEILDLTGIDDEEIDSYIMSDREIKFKTELWMKLNEEYLEELRVKEEKEKEEAELRAKEGKPEKKKKVYNKRQKNAGPANTAGEAIEKMLQDKKLSNKINYDVLRNLNGEDNEEEKMQLPIEETKVSRLVPNYLKSQPVEKPEKIHHIMHSLTGKRASNDFERSEVSPSKKRNVGNLDSASSVHKREIELKNEEMDEEDEEEEEEEEDTNEESGGGVFQFLQMRRNDDFYDDAEYD